MAFNKTAFLKATGRFVVQFVFLFLWLFALAFLWATASASVTDRVIYLVSKWKTCGYISSEAVKVSTVVNVRWLTLTSSVVFVCKALSELCDYLPHHISFINELHELHMLCACVHVWIISFRRRTMFFFWGLFGEQSKQWCKSARKCSNFD